MITLQHLAHELAYIEWICFGIDGQPVSVIYQSLIPCHRDQITPELLRERMRETTAFGLRADAVRAVDYFGNEIAREARLH